MRAHCVYWLVKSGLSVIFVTKYIICDKVNYERNDKLKAQPLRQTHGSTTGRKRSVHFEVAVSITDGDSGTWGSVFSIKVRRFISPEAKPREVLRTVESAGSPRKFCIKVANPPGGRTTLKLA